MRSAKPYLALSSNTKSLKVRLSDLFSEITSLSIVFEEYKGKKLNPVLPSILSNCENIASVFVEIISEHVGDIFNQLEIICDSLRKSLADEKLTEQEYKILFEGKSEFQLENNDEFIKFTKMKFTPTTNQNQDTQSKELVNRIAGKFKRVRV